ncbi:hypothetical protein D9M68_433740 [compost metagenome]
MPLPTLLSQPRASSAMGRTRKVPAMGPLTVPRPPISANMATWIDSSSENAELGSTKVR